MKTKQVLFNMVLLMAFLVSACSGAATPTADTMMEKVVPTAEAMMDKATPTADAMMSKETPTADAMDTMMEVPAWYSASLTNASTGDFEQADLTAVGVVLR